MSGKKIIRENPYLDPDYRDRLLRLFPPYQNAQPNEVMEAIMPENALTTEQYVRLECMRILTRTPLISPQELKALVIPLSRLILQGDQSQPEGTDGRE